MGMMNLGGGRGTIGMPVPQGARWLGQPAGPAPAQVNEMQLSRGNAMPTQTPMASQLPAAPSSQMMQPAQPAQMGGAGEQSMMNAWAQQPPPQRGIGPQLRNPLARLLAGG